MVEMLACVICIVYHIRPKAGKEKRATGNVRDINGTLESSGSRKEREERETQERPLRENLHSSTGNYYVFTTGEARHLVPFLRDGHICET